MTVRWGSSTMALPQCHNTETQNNATMPQCHNATMPPCHHATMPQCDNATMPHAAMLQCRNTETQNKAAMPQCRNPTTQKHRNNAEMSMTHLSLIEAMADALWLCPLSETGPEQLLPFPCNLPKFAGPTAHGVLGPTTSTDCWSVGRTRRATDAAIPELNVILIF